MGQEDPERVAGLDAGVLFVVALKMHTPTAFVGQFHQFMEHLGAGQPRFIYKDQAISSDGLLELLIAKELLERFSLLERFRDRCGASFLPQLPSIGSKNVARTVRWSAHENIPSCLDIGANQFTGRERLPGPGIANQCVPPVKRPNESGHSIPLFGVEAG